MELRRIIPSDITASAIAHVSLLTLLVLFSDVRPFGAVTAEQIPVEIVTPQDLAEQQMPRRADRLRKTSRNRCHSPISPGSTSRPLTPHRRRPQPPAPAARPQKQAALATPRAAQPPAAIATGGAGLQAARAGCLDQVSGAARPAARPLADAAGSRARPDKGDDNFDGPATEAADIASTLIAAFRRHLKTCSKLPASLSGADDVKVKLRVLMTPDGRLAAEPILIEASASMKGPLLMQGAIRALQACQPYAMLPADRYGEWKVLDLNFTPQDFSAS